MQLNFKIRQEQKEHYDPCNNYLGWEYITINVFNYDGKGGAIGTANGELETFFEDDIRFLISSGWYDSEGVSDLNKRLEEKEAQLNDLSEKVAELHRLNFPTE